jgi:hypothetical protein
MIRVNDNVRWLGRIGVLLLAACNEGSVGSENCVGTAIRCTLPVRSQSDKALLQEVPVKDLPLVAPTWIRALPALPESAHISNPEVALTRDADDAVWLFVSQPDGVLVASLDDQGAVSDSVTIAAPKALVGIDVSGTQLSTPVQSVGGPSMEVEWAGQCGPAVQGVFCAASFEQITFDTGDLRSSKRRTADESLLRDAQGNRYTGTGSPVRLEKRDADDRLLWAQTALQRLGAVALRGNALFDDGKQGGFVAYEAVSSDPCGSRIRELVVLDEQGDIEALSGLGLSTYGLLELDCSTAFVRDSSAGPALAGTMPGYGDLLLLQSHDAPVRFEGARFLRQDFLSLYPSVAAASSDAVLYALTSTGGRDQADQNAVLCRAPTAGTAGCFALPRLDSAESEEIYRSNSLVAKRGGVLYLASNTQLMRIDLPQ